MINFYKFYNKTGLDNEHYDPLIKQMMDFRYTIELKPIEHLIKKKPWHAYEYAKYAIKGRFHVGEPIIMKDPQYACYYAMDVIKGRWKGIGYPEVEDIIMKSSYNAYHYAISVIKSRWYEAEQYMMHDKFLWDKYYCKEFNIC